MDERDERKKVDYLKLAEVNLGFVPPKQPEGSRQAVQRMAGAVYWVDPDTGRGYWKRDAAFHPAFSAANLSSNGVRSKSSTSKRLPSE